MSTKRDGSARRGEGRGAQVRKKRTGSKLVNWVHHHRESALGSLRRIFRHPLQSLATCLVIAVALAMPALMYLGVNNVQQLDQHWNGNPKFTLFLKEAPKLEALDLWRQQLLENPLIASVTYISPERALDDFEQASGLGAAIRILDENPLPPVLEVLPEASAEPYELDQLALKFNADVRIDDMVFDRTWVKRLHALLAAGQRLALLTALLLGFGILIIIGNTLRLAVENRREEIIVIKLVGGSRAFVRRPFLYSGFWLGLLGGLLTLLMVWGVSEALREPIAQLVSAYGSSFRLQGPDVSEVVVFLAGAAGLGLIGAWLSVGRHLKAVEPE